MALPGQGCTIILASSDWTGIVGVGVQRVLGIQCLGLNLANAEVFVHDNAQIEDQIPSKELSRQGWAAGIFLDTIILTPVIGHIAGLVMKLSGYSGLPKSSEAIDTLQSNSANYGYNILIPAFSIPDFDLVVNLIQDRSNAEKANSGMISLTATLESRLRTIDSLREKGLITEEEFKQKRSDIIDKI